MVDFDTAAIEAICRQRLTSRRNDGDIAGEVLAASLCGKAHVVHEIIDQLLVSGHPADSCLAVTLAGYSDGSAEAAALIARFNGAEGFIGTAQKAAKVAHDKNAWSRFWHEQTRQAEDRLTFWQGSVLLAKIVDLRFDLWKDSVD